MTSTEIRKMLQEAIENKDWNLIEDAENKIFEDEVIDIISCNSWLTQGSDFREYIKKPERSKIEFIYLNNWRGSQVSDFLEDNFDRIDEIIYILEKWMKDYDQEN